jgi:hypothetical protein
VSSTNKTDHHDTTEILLKVHGVKHPNPNSRYQRSLPGEVTVHNGSKKKIIIAMKKNVAIKIKNVAIKIKNVAIKIFLYNT